MKIKTSLSQMIQILVLMGLSTTALSQECGDEPVAPSIVDGASASMDDLVANSQEVKGFIAEADVFLDCLYEYRDTVAYKDLDDAAKDEFKTYSTEILDSRNAIGDVFNEQVAAYRAANP